MGVINMNENKLVLKDLTKKYKNGDGVEDIQLEVKAGELLTLLGPSGCGKTTILRMLGGFQIPDRGEILLDGQDIAKLPPEKRPTGMVFQSYNLWPHMTIYDNLAFGLKLRKVDKAVIKDEIQKILKLVKMENSEKKYPTQLSGGQQQRIAIARALLLKPSVLLLDEPFSALDAKIRMEMREELKKIQRELGITVVFVTHDQEEAMALSDRIVVMNKGCIEQIGTPTEIYDQPSSQFVASFIGSMNFIPQVDDEVVAVRPEDIRLTNKEESKLKGIIRSSMVLGHFMEVHIDTSQGVIKAFLPRSSKRYASGEEVGIELVNEKRFKKAG